MEKYVLIFALFQLDSPNDLFSNSTSITGPSYLESNSFVSYARRSAARFACPGQGLG